MAQIGGRERIDVKVHSTPGLDAEIARLAARQLGLVAVWQLLELGVGRGAIESRVRASRLHRVHRRVRSRPGIRAFTVRYLDPRDRRMLGPVPVTSPARTVIDLAGALEPERVEPLIAEAQGRRLMTPRDLEQAIDRAPLRPGVAVVRSLTQAPKLTRREGELRLLRLIRQAGLPEPECNVEVGPYVVDVLWSDQKLVAEFDSRKWHGDHVHGRFESDRRRDGRLLALGYRTKRVTWKELTREPDELVALLRTLRAQ